MSLFEETFIKHRALVVSNNLNEIFAISHRQILKKELMMFLQKQFESGNIKSVHGGISTVEYKSTDWIEPMADNMIQHMVEYFETIRSQTEKDMNSNAPLEQD